MLRSMSRRRPSCSGWSARLRIEYFRRGTTLIARGADNHHLYVLRSGAADLRDQDGELVERSDAGATFGSITLTQGNPSTFEVVAIEDSLAYLLAAETFYRLVRDHPAVARFLSDQRAARTRPAVDALSSPTTGDAVLRIRVADLVRREPVCATASTTIRDAAAIMAAQGVSALLIMDGDRLTGIITDRDLRSRVLATGLEPTRPISEVMTPDPITRLAGCAGVRGDARHGRTHDPPSPARRRRPPGGHRHQHRSATT